MLRQRAISRMIHGAFMMVALIVLAPPIRAQRRNDYLAEQFQSQERHLDNTDANVMKVREMTEDNRETISEYRGYFLGITGLLTLINLLGLRFQFHRAKESNG